MRGSEHFRKCSNGSMVCLIQSQRALEIPCCKRNPWDAQKRVPAPQSISQGLGSTSCNRPLRSRKITTLVGQLDRKAQRDTINSLWQMTSQVPAGDEWASINAGFDFSTRQ